MRSQRAGHDSGTNTNGIVVKNLPAHTGDVGSTPEPGRSPEKKEMETHSSVLAWEIPWTEEAGGLQSLGLQKSWA